MTTALPTNSSSNSINLLTALAPILIGSGKQTGTEQGGLNGNALQALTGQLTGGQYSAGQATADTNNAVNNSLKMAFQSFVPKIGAAQSSAGVYNSSMTNQQMAQEVGNASAAAGQITANQINAYQQNQTQLAGVLSNNSKTAISQTAPSINPVQALMGVVGMGLGNSAIDAVGQATGLSSIKGAQVLQGDLSSLPSWLPVGSGNSAVNATNAVPKAIDGLTEINPADLTMTDSLVPGGGGVLPISASGAELTPLAAIDANAAMAGTASSSLASSGGATIGAASDLSSALTTGAGVGSDVAAGVGTDAAGAVGADMGASVAADVGGVAAADAGGAAAAGAAGAGMGISDILPAIMALTVICTKLNEFGYLTEAQYEADCIYGTKLRSTNPPFYYWYLRNATPVANIMTKDSMLTKFIWLIAKHWINHMAYEVGYRATDSIRGKLVMKAGYTAFRISEWFRKEYNHVSI